MMAAQGRALSHLKVVEAGSFIAGPFCGQILGDLGADVIKIEPPLAGDAMRKWGAVKASNGQSLWWSVISRNKQSLTLDLRRSEGQAVFRDLVRTADVLIENFRPGVLEGWGLAPEMLRRDNPGLIVARVSGFGQTGPLRNKAGFAAVAEAEAGLRTLTGFPDRPPVRVGISIGDSLAGLYAAIGILAALAVRDRIGGFGQDVDVAITESVLGVMESIIAEYADSGAIRQRAGMALPGIAPSNLYPTADGSSVIIAANADGLFRSLCTAMGRPDLAQDPRFASHIDRGRHQAEIDAIVAQWTAGHVQSDIVALMDRHGIPAGVVNTAAEVARHTHFRDRSAIIEVADPDIGPVTMQGTFPRLGRTPGAVRWTGPRLGEHTREILARRLGYGEEDIENLRAGGII